MTKKEKLLKKFLEKPLRKDLTFKDLEICLKHLGYDLFEGSGSRVKFYNSKTEDLFLLHKPHPSPILKHYLVKAIQNKLKRIS